MAANDVKLCMSDLKNKKCEGYDRIPLCALFGAHGVLLPPMANLFSQIYSTCKIPEQLKVAKITPIYLLNLFYKMNNSYYH